MKHEYEHSLAEFLGSEFERSRFAVRGFRGRKCSYERLVASVVRVNEDGFDFTVFGREFLREDRFPLGVFGEEGVSIRDPDFERNLLVETPGRLFGVGDLESHTISGFRGMFEEAGLACGHTE